MLSFISWFLLSSCRKLSTNSPRKPLRPDACRTLWGKGTAALRALNMVKLFLNMWRKTQSMVLVLAGGPGYLQSSSWPLLATHPPAWGPRRTSAGGQDASANHLEQKGPGCRHSVQFKCFFFLWKQDCCSIYLHIWTRDRQRPALTGNPSGCWRASVLWHKNSMCTKMETQVSLTSENIERIWEKEKDDADADDATRPQATENSPERHRG